MYIGNQSMHGVNCYFEENNISKQYFTRLLREVLNLFSLKKKSFFKISKIEDLKIPNYSENIRIILTNKKITTDYNDQIYLDGIGFQQKRIILINYQRASLKSTMFLLAHEMGHVFGMPHCSNKNCIMGITKEGKNVKYAWKDIAESRKMSKTLFCMSCKSHSKLSS